MAVTLDPPASRRPPGGTPQGVPARSMAGSPHRACQESTLTQQQFPWQRRVFVLDEPPAQGRYGWPPSYARAGVPLAQERATAIIVLRGERGMGKTYALRQEHDAL